MLGAMEIRAIAAHELEAWIASLIRTFGGDAEGDPHAVERHRALVDLDRTFAAFDGGRIVGTAAGFDFRLSVPGGVVPMSGLTMVSVSPTHRRRGILRALITAHLAAARARGDVMSGLWASEATIYGRFGYGVAAEADELTFSAAGARMIDTHARDAIELAPDGDAVTLMPAVYDAAMARRPGLFSRSADWWRLRIMVERPYQKTGASKRRFAIARRDGAPVGYAVFRQKLAFEAGLPAGTIDIDELCAIDAAAEASLWDFIAKIDLFPKVSWRNAPTDSLLPWIVDDRRRVRRSRVETMWLRVDEVAPVLEARRYASDGSLRLGVEDEVFTLTIEGGAGRCERSEGAPELTLDRAALGSLYLGSFAASYLARAGRVHGEVEALARADRIFACALAPWCAEIF